VLFISFQRSLKYRDPQKLASTLLELMKNHELRTALASNGMETVKAYDINSVAPEIGSMYKSLLKSERLRA
jgi:glycosyltransferase involved in cell wall biosynthesis